MLDSFNEYFIASGYPFDTLNHLQEKSERLVTACQPFSFKTVTVTEVHKALKLLDTSKPAGPDNLGLYFFKISH